LKQLSKESLGIEIRNDHRDFLKMKIFNWPDLMNFHVIRYFTYTTRVMCNRLFPVCGCGAQNTPEHGANECVRTLVNGESINKEFDSLFASCSLNKKTNIFEYLREVFFCIDKVQAKTLRKLVDLMKKTILQININDSSIDNRLVNQAHYPVELEIEDEENTNVANDTTVLNDESTYD